MEIKYATGVETELDHIRERNSNTCCAVSPCLRYLDRKHKQ